jgi:hypothetical protein
MDMYKNYNASVLSSSFHASTDCDTECEAKVISSETLPPAENFPLKAGEFKIPKVLAEFVVQIDSESKIKLSEPAFEIKRIEKQVFLTQCRFIPPTDKVFIEGYIRKNIEYASKNCSKHAIAGTIKDTTVQIPFKVFTRVKFEHKPEIRPNAPPMVTRYFDEKRMGKNIREADRSNVEVFNEPVFCELEWTAIFDADIDEKGKPIDGFLNEEEFQEFTDKSVVFIAIKLLQKQQVCWPEPHFKDFKDNKDCKDDCEKPEALNQHFNMPISDFLDKK